MKSRIFVGVFILTLAYAGYVLAAEGDMMAAPVMMEKKMDESTPAEKTCPMCGGAMEEANGIQVEYNGKTYTLCSAMCAKAFQDNPEVAIKKMEMMDGKMEDGMKMDMGDMKEDMGDMGGMMEEPEGTEPASAVPTDGMKK